jgi:stage V sporulation protein AE
MMAVNAPSPTPIIIVTDGDRTAAQALRRACRELDLDLLEASQGNPTPSTGPDLIAAIHHAERPPVVVMVDDRGRADMGPGERVLAQLLQATSLNVIGVVAVAANTRPVQGVPVPVSVSQTAQVVASAVDKAGHPQNSHRLKGDTVDVLQHYRGPIIGLGDPGKMDGHDRLSAGAPATRRALEEILTRAGFRTQHPVPQPVTPKKGE